MVIPLFDLLFAPIENQISVMCLLECNVFIKVTHFLKNPSFLYEVISCLILKVTWVACFVNKICHILNDRGKLIQ